MCGTIAVVHANLRILEGGIPRELCLAFVRERADVDTRIRYVLSSPIFHSIGHLEGGRMRLRARPSMV